MKKFKVSGVTKDRRDDNAICQRQIVTVEAESAEDARDEFHRMASYFGVKVLDRLETKEVFEESEVPKC